MSPSFKLLCFTVLLLSIHSKEIFMATNGNDSTGDGLLKDLQNSY